jgi:hypothetical protein
MKIVPYRPFDVARGRQLQGKLMIVIAILEQPVIATESAPGICDDGPRRQAPTRAV